MTDRYHGVRLYSRLLHCCSFGFLYFCYSLLIRSVVRSFLFQKSSSSIHAKESSSTSKPLPISISTSSLPNPHLPDRRDQVIARSIQPMQAYPILVLFSSSPSSKTPIFTSSSHPSQCHEETSNKDTRSTTPYRISSACSVIHISTKLHIFLLPYPLSYILSSIHTTHSTI